MTVSPGPSASRQGESSCKRILFMQKSILCSLMQKKYDRWQRRAVLHHSSTRRRGQWPFLMHCFVGLCLVLWPQKVWYSNLVVLWSFVLIFSCFVLFYMEVPRGFNFANSQFFSNYQLPQNDNKHLKASGGSHYIVPRCILCPFAPDLVELCPLSSLKDSACTFQHQIMKKRKRKKPHFW